SGETGRYRSNVFGWPAKPKLARLSCERRLERETGIEPATNSLEGCDSTTELLPPPRLASIAHSSIAHSPLRRGRPAVTFTALARRFGSLGCPLGSPSRSSLAPARAKDGGEGRTRTFEAARATDLQSAAFDRFATSPAVCCLETKCF